MVPTPRLTKRQRKGIAFRERKLEKGQNSRPDASENEIDVPSLEDQALIDASQGPQGDQISAKSSVWQRKAREERDERVVVAGKKRKKTKEEEGTLGPSDAPTSKRKKGPDGAAAPVAMGLSVEDYEGAEETERGSEKTKQRFILFLGNLKYTTTIEAIQAHFSACAPPPTVRLLTPKRCGKSPVRSVTKSKGCAFLEFTHRGALQQGLKLHHSQLDGREINVELTAGGGGKGSTRMKKVKDRNKELEGQRRKRQGSNVDAQVSGTQRFSATSGEEKAHTQKRTWTIGEVEEKVARRGGQKHRKGSKKQGSRVKSLGTGVNAIPVG